MPVKKLFTYVVQQNLSRNLHLAGLQCAQTHYDTLKLGQNCSVKEIREAFIKLSMQCHPDRNQSDPRNHARFVKLNEAYSVLSRPDKRKVYDESVMSLKQYQHHTPTPTTYTYTSYAKVHYAWDADGKSKSYSHDSENFYGIRGVKRVSNATIALLCLAVASIGVILQVVAIRIALTLSRKQLDVKSQETGEILAKVREDALRHGKERQLELLRERVIRSGMDVPPLDFGKEAITPEDALGDKVVPADLEAAKERTQMPASVGTTPLPDIGS